MLGARSVPGHLGMVCLKRFARTAASAEGIGVSTEGHSEGLRGGAGVSPRAAVPDVTNWLLLEHASPPGPCLLGASSPWAQVRHSISTKSCPQGLLLAAHSSPRVWWGTQPQKTPSFTKSWSVSGGQRVPRSEGRDEGGLLSVLPMRRPSWSAAQATWPIQSLPPATALLFRTKSTPILEHKS